MRRCASSAGTSNGRLCNQQGSEEGEPLGKTIRSYRAWIQVPPTRLTNGAATKNNNVERKLAIKQEKLSANSGCFHCSTSLALVVNCTVDQCSNRINAQQRPHGATTEPNVKPKCTLKKRLWGRHENKIVPTRNQCPQEISRNGTRKCHAGAIKCPNKAIKYKEFTLIFIHVSATLGLTSAAEKPTACTRSGPRECLHHTTHEPKTRRADGPWRVRSSTNCPSRFFVYEYARAKRPLGPPGQK